jgi:hypothetical protein
MCGRILEGWAGGAAARRWLVGVAVAVLALVFSGRAEAGPLYSIQTIDYPGAASTEARGINNHGHVVGRYFASDGGIHGSFYDGVAFQEIAFPGAYHTDAIGINDQGQIVGTYITSTPERQSVGFLFDAGQYTSIYGPGARWSRVPVAVRQKHGLVDNPAEFAPQSHPGFKVFPRADGGGQRPVQSECSGYRKRRPTLGGRRSWIESEWGGSRGWRLGWGPSVGDAQ